MIRDYLIRFGDYGIVIVNMSKKAIIETLLKTAIEDVVTGYLCLDEGEPDTVYLPFKEELLSQVMTVVDQLQIKHSAELAKAKKAASDPGKVKKSTSKSGGTRNVGTYARFVGGLKYLKTESKDGKTRSDVPDLANMEITVGDNFRNRTSKCATFFQQHKTKLRHNDEEIDGQTMTMANLYDAIIASKDEEGLGNSMSRAGMMWGLISENDQKKFLELLQEV